MASKTVPLIPYIRQSRKKEQTISIEAQRDHIERWAKAHGVKLAPEVVEQGVSGSKPWRERELGNVIKAIENGEAGGIVVAFQDRLSRENGLGTAEVWNALKSSSARLVCAAEGLDTGTGEGLDDDIDAEMLFTIKSAVARSQWRRYKKNWHDAVDKAIGNGKYVGTTPVGFTRNGDGTMRQSETANAVREVFLGRARGRSWNKLADDLEAAGVLTATGSMHWHVNSVRSLVRNPVYKGILRNGIEHFFASLAIVTGEEWDAAQEKGKTPARRDGGVWATLAGIVTCASCGRRMSPSRDQRGFAYYRCQYRACASKGRAVAEELDVLVIEEALQQFARKVAETGIGEDADIERITTLEETLRRAKAAERRGITRLDPDDDEDAQLLEDLAAEVEAAAAALDTERRRVRRFPSVEEVEAILAGVDIEAKREAIRRVVAEVRVEQVGTHVKPQHAERAAADIGYVVPADGYEPSKALADRVEVVWR